jgi:hypothetical protein
MPVIVDIASTDIGVLSNASSLRWRTESAAVLIVASSRASVVALQIVLPMSDMFFYSTPKYLP